MDFKNASELLALCAQQQLPVSEIMRRRECELGESTRDEVTHRMTHALEIMRTSAMTPLKTPVKSMGGLIGGEAKKLAQHDAKGRSICGDVLHRAAQYAMAVLEVNASMGLIVAAPPAGSRLMGEWTAAYRPTPQSRPQAAMLRVLRGKWMAFLGFLAGFGASSAGCMARSFAFRSSEA